MDDREVEKIRGFAASKGRSISEWVKDALLAQLRLTEAFRKHEHIQPAKLVEYDPDKLAAEMYTLPPRRSAGR